MTAKTNALPPRGDSVPAPHIEWLHERSDERLLLAWASVLAVIVHGLAFMIDLPEPRAAVPQQPPDAPPIYTTPLPPPPPLVTTPLPPITTTRHTPIPDREPEAPEPVSEPLPAVLKDRVIDPLGEVLLAPVVQPPKLAPPAGPIRITPDIRRPVLIEDSKIPPEYPPLARQAGIPGDVILEAVIHRDGSVGDITVLQSAPPGLGFEDAAIEAVRQWRYEPARHLGEPVEVYFTVYVRFELR